MLRHKNITLIDQSWSTHHHDAHLEDEETIQSLTRIACRVEEVKETSLKLCLPVLSGTGSLIASFKMNFTLTPGNRMPYASAEDSAHRVPF